MVWIFVLGVLVLAVISPGFRALLGLLLGVLLGVLVLVLLWGWFERQGAAPLVDSTAPLALKRLERPSARMATSGIGDLTGRPQSGSTTNDHVVRAAAAL